MDAHETFLAESKRLALIGRLISMAQYAEYSLSRAPVPWDRMEALMQMLRGEIDRQKGSE